MKLIFGLFVPFLLICLPLVVQLIFMTRTLKGKRSIPILAGFIISFVAGLFMPLVAFNMSVSVATADWPKDEPQCLTGFAVILMLGYLMDIAGSLIIGLIGWVLYRETQKVKSYKV